MSHRGEFESEVRKRLEVSLSSEGFLVEEFTSQITPPQSLAEAINAKNEAVQNALKAENKVKEAEANAQNRNRQGTRARHRHCASKATAKPITTASWHNRLSPLLVQQDAIDKWDGKLPTYSGGGALPFINIGK